MALPESSLSTVCTAIYNFVRLSLNAAANNISVSMGAPAEVSDSEDEHRLNLFFYRFEPGGFDANTHPNEPWRVRIFCLITAFGVDEDGIFAGENELRILGEVMRIFHEKPVMDAVSVGSEQVRLQAVFTPATDEQINQIWSTQGDTSYRPSVAYEMALAPIMPSTLRPAPALVGAIGQQARAATDARYSSFSGVVQGPPVLRTEVDIGNPRWTPAICWVHNGACAHSLSIDAQSPFNTRIWLAGDTNETVQLTWEIWDSSGWRRTGSTESASPFSTVLDPDRIPAGAVGFPLNVSNPVAIPDGEQAAQGLLYASRTITPIPGEAPIELRSNPLLLSLYRSAQP